MHVSGQLTGLISTRFKLCADVGELDGSYNDGTVPVSAAVIDRVWAYIHYSYREQGYNPESLDRVVHTPENDAGKGDEGAVSEDVEGSNCVVQDGLDNDEELQKASGIGAGLTWSTHFPLPDHGLGSEHWNARAITDANDHARTMPSRTRLHSTARLSDIILWRRYERDAFAVAMVAMRRSWAAYSYYASR
jgi:hypothetical protein